MSREEVGGCDQVRWGGEVGGGCQVRRRVCRGGEVKRWSGMGEVRWCGGEGAGDELTRGVRSRCVCGGEAQMKRWVEGRTAGCLCDTPTPQRSHDMTDRWGWSREGGIACHVIIPSSLCACVPRH